MTVDTRCRFAGTLTTELSIAVVGARCATGRIAAWTAIFLLALWAGRTITTIFTGAEFAFRTGRTGRASITLWTRCADCAVFAGAALGSRYLVVTYWTLGWTLV